MRLCFLCGGVIHGRFETIWVQPIGGQDAPVGDMITWQDAHVDCAALLRDDDDDDTDDADDKRGDANLARIAGKRFTED